MSINNMATLCLQIICLQIICLQIICLQIICVRILSVCGFSLCADSLCLQELLPRTHKKVALGGRTLSHELRANNDDQDNGGRQNGRSGDSQDHGGT